METPREFRPSPALLASERLVALSDGVFSIAATLLVIDVRLPGGETSFQWSSLAAISWRILAYAISFLVIGQLWIVYHRRMRFVAHLDTRAAWLNLLFLMAVAFIPFPTSVLSEYGNTEAVVLYAVTFVTASVLLSLFWFYASRHHAWLVAGTTVEEIRRERRRSFAPPVVFLASIPLAFVDPDWAMYFWLLLVPIAGLQSRR